MVDGYLRVEIRRADGSYIPVTREWLELGFARGLNPPTNAAPNPVHPNAILLLQKPADRIGNGVLDTAGAPQVCGGGFCGILKPPEVATDAVSNSIYYGDGANATSPTRYNWYPLNFYDAREGELRELPQPNAATTCKVGGVMNAVEIDVRNLQRWLNGTIGANGTQTEVVTQNGYVLYFSDRRGMLPNPNAGNVKSGEYGFEDVINPAVSAGTPNGNLDTGEDSDGNGLLDTWGATNLGLGFGAGNTGNPVTAVTCMSMARKNWIAGARHAVRLVHGT